MPPMFGYPLNPVTLIWVVSALATAGVIIRPFSWPEAIWAVLGGGVLLAPHLIGFDTVRTGVLKGTDVYLFLLGVMLLAETARQEGLFDWLAALATKRAAGSPQRLFLLIFGVGTIVTIIPVE
jgi:arsenical pump membrane protein